MIDLSILIPARNEEFLGITVQNILDNIEGNTEIIVILDGVWFPIPDHPRVRLVKFPESIGQRAATNVACRMSTAKYVMKVDAHCAFDKGFDVKMMADMQDDWTMIPVMRNLHAFNWLCKNNHRRYQGPSGKCKECNEETKKEMIWKPKNSPQSTAFFFDKTMHFQYFSDLKRRQKGDLVETMSIQGSCFMLTRKKYWELNICDEKHGSWGQQGVEVACKTWLSGGRVVCNKNTWYAHMFRTQGGDFGFPYPNVGTSKARKFSRDLWQGNKWPQAIHTLEWLIEKFAPVPTWDVKPLKKGMIFYTDNRLELRIARAAQYNLREIAEQKSMRITSASLKNMSHMGNNVHLDLKRGYLTMFRQIVAALELSDADIVYLCEHDVIYHPSHFDFTPTKRNVFYYNINVWKVNKETGLALWVDECRQVSGLVGFREELLKHYKERVAKVEAVGRYENNMGFEPGTSNRVDWENQYTSENFKSHHPNIDIRHTGNLTPNRWRKDQFRNQRWTQGWKEAILKDIPGWDFNTGFLDFIASK